MEDRNAHTSVPINDLLAKRWVPYSYIYPFAEGAAGDWSAVYLENVLGSSAAIAAIRASPTTPAHCPQKW